MTTNNSKFFNDGPIGERDCEDAGNRYYVPRRPLTVGKAPTTADLKILQTKITVIVDRMVETYTKSKGFAPNHISMQTFRNAADLELRTGIQKM